MSSRPTSGRSAGPRGLPRGLGACGWCSAAPDRSTCGRRTPAPPACRRRSATASHSRGPPAGPPGGPPVRRGEARSSVDSPAIQHLPASPCSRPAISPGAGAPGCLPEPECAIGGSPPPVAGGRRPSADPRRWPAAGPPPTGARGRAQPTKHGRAAWSQPDPARPRAGRRRTWSPVRDAPMHQVALQVEVLSLGPLGPAAARSPEAMPSTDSPAPASSLRATSVHESAAAGATRDPPPVGSTPDRCQGFQERHPGRHPGRGPPDPGAAATVLSGSATPNGHLSRRSPPITGRKAVCTWHGKRTQPRRSAREPPGDRALGHPAARAARGRHNRRNGRPVAVRHRRIDRGG